MKDRATRRYCPRCNSLVLKHGLDPYDSCFTCGYIDTPTIRRGRRLSKTIRQTFTAPPEKPGRTPPNGLTVNAQDNKLQLLCIIPWARRLDSPCRHHFVSPDAGRYPRPRTTQVCRVCGLVQKVSNAMPSMARLYGVKAYGGREGKARHDDEARVTAIVSSKTNRKPIKRPQAPYVSKWVWRTLDGRRMESHEAESLELVGAR